MDVIRIILYQYKYIVQFLQPTSFKNDLKRHHDSHQYNPINTGFHFDGYHNNADKTQYIFVVQQGINNLYACIWEVEDMVTFGVFSNNKKDTVNTDVIDLKKD